MTNAPSRIRAIRKTATGELFAFSEELAKEPGYEIYNGPPPVRTPKQVIIDGTYTKLEPQVPVTPEPQAALPQTAQIIESGKPGKSPKTAAVQATPVVDTRPALTAEQEEQFAKMRAFQTAIENESATEQDLKDAWTGLYRISPQAVQAVAARLGKNAEQVIDMYVDPSQ
jgi:hypothetical protein